MPYLPVPDGEIFYEVHGSGPPLIFAHGLGGNHLSWWQQVAHFAGRFTCVTFSHRRFFPARVAAQPDPARFASDLAELIDHLCLRRVALVAQSMGGWACLDYALEHPENVRCSQFNMLVDEQLAR